MISKQQNRPTHDFIPIFQFALFLIVLFSLLFIASNVFGATPFEDYFDDYSIGNLVPQGSWATTSSPGSPQTTTTASVSAPISIWLNSTPKSAFKLGEQVIEGGWSFWTKINSDPGTNSEVIMISLTEGNYFADVAQIFFHCVGNNCESSELCNVYTCGSTGNFDVCQIPIDTWVSWQVQWDASTNETRWKCGDEPWTDWQGCYGSTFSYVQGIEIQAIHTGKLKMHFDSLSSTPFSSMEITSPTTESSKSAEFYLQGNFNIKDEDWDRVMVIFEQWHASSTCPNYDSEDWETEYANGWLITQSMPFFSDFISTTTGNFSILVDDLRTGTYNCTKCFFINETEETISPQKCQGYTLTITEITPSTAEFYYPFSTWQTYYTTSSEEFATSTPLFENMANALTPIVNKMGDFILYAKDYFDSSEAMAKGNELGQAIPKARGYLEMIDDFIGLPLSSLVIFYFLTMAVVISYKVILTIIKLLKP